MKFSLPSRVLEKVDPPLGDETCWLWNAYTEDGYGRLWWEGGRIQAHVLFYLAYVGEIPDGLELDHLCRVRHCVNPDHLEPVTKAENIRRGRAGQPQLARTHCPQGHPYDSENTYVTPDGRRDCRTCRTEASRRHKAKVRVS